MARLGLFARSNRSGRRGTLLAFAASDLHERMKSGSHRAEVTYDVLASVSTTLTNQCGMAVVPVPAPRRVYRTMQFYLFRIIDLSAL